VFLLRVDERRDDLGVCVVQCAKTCVRRAPGKEMGIHWQTASPLKERLFVPLLKRLIAHDGARHLLVLPVDALLCKDQQFRRIVAFKSYTLAIQLSDLTESLARKRSCICGRCNMLTSLKISAWASDRFATRST
jgi:hypothetical protein